MGGKGCDCNVKESQLIVLSGRHDADFLSNREPSSHIITIPNCSPFLHMKYDLQSGDECHPVACGGHPVAAVAGNSSPASSSSWFGWASGLDVRGTGSTAGLGRVAFLLGLGVGCDVGERVVGAAVSLEDERSTGDVASASAATSAAGEVEEEAAATTSSTSSLNSFKTFLKLSILSHAPSAA